MRISSSVKAILAEIAAALQKYAQTDAVHTIFIDKLGLMPEERQAIRELLGQGALTITLTATEPAEWRESGIAGVWYGVFFDQTRKPLLETVEVGAFPQVAAAQQEDVLQGIAVLQERLSGIEGA